MIAEHHGLHIDRRAPGSRDVMELAVGDGARIHPAGKDRPDGAPELLVRVLRERNAELFLDGRLVAGDDLAPLVGADIGVEFMTEARLLVLEDFLEDLVVKPMTTSAYIWMKRR
jgi:electron transfer flavoprotein alpha subunit